MEIERKKCHEQQPHWSCKVPWQEENLLSWNNNFLALIGHLRHDVIFTTTTGALRVLLSCVNKGFCYLNLTEITKFKYERKNEKDSGRSSTMTPSGKWPIRRSSATLQPVVNSFPVKEYQSILFEQIQGLCIRTASLSRYKFYSISTALLSHHCLKSVKTVITCRFSILQTWFFPTQSFQLLFAHLQLQSNEVRWQSTLSDALILVNSL